MLSVSGIEKPVHLNDRSAPGCGSAPIKEDSERGNDNSIRRPSPEPAADAGTATTYGEALNFKTPVKFSLWSRNPGDMYLGRPSQHPREGKQASQHDSEAPEARILCAADQHLCCVIRHALHCACTRRTVSAPHLASLTPRLYGVELASVLPIDLKPAGP